MKLNKLIFATLAGSHLYGTNTPESDIDIRGVCLTSPDIILGWGNFEQYQPGKEEALEWSNKNFGYNSDDICIYALDKFLKLASDANPNIIELLFADNLLWKNKVHPLENDIWYKIISHKDWFLSTKVIYTFAGYAYSQLKRIKSHKKWLENPPIKPNSYDYGYLEDGRWKSEQRKREYHKLKDEWDRFNTWRTNRNLKRFKLEKEHGYDTKHAMHLYRLIIECETLLTEGRLDFPLSKEKLNILKEVYNGQISYEEVICFAESCKDALLEIPTDLPKKPNRKKINELLIEINYNLIKNYKLSYQ